MSIDTVKPTHAVLYTDGGCDNTEIAGWGIHGYFFHAEPAKQGTGNPKALPTLQGYLMGKSGKPDITLTHYVDAFGSVTENATNNVAEAMASYNALKIVKDTGLRNVTLIKDSQYALQGFDKWMYDWQKNNWTRKDGQPVSNIGLWKQIYALKAELTAEGVTFKTQWVKGHSGDLGNDRADELASAGKACARNKNPRESFRIVDAKGFWNTKSERNRMFSLPNWYFAGYLQDTVEGREAYRGRHLYYIGTIRDDIELIGKAIADASFAVLLLKETDPVLDIVREGTQDMYVGRPQGVMVGYLDQIFKSSMYENILDFGRDLLLKDRRNRRLMTRDKKLLLHETDPPGLSFRLMDHLGSLEDRLRDYLKIKDGVAVGKALKSHLGTSDITDILYEKSEAKNKVSVKLKNTITSGTRSLKVPAKYRNEQGEDKEILVTLTLAQDLPERNTLAALANPEIKVTLLTWPESSRAIRFAVIIESNDDVGIWAGPYANMQMLPLK
jgi:ribonuclease HI